jgi:hypothetical protein
MSKDSNPKRFTTDQNEIRMLGPTIRTVDHLTPQEKADNAAHQAGLKKIFESNKKEE